ncbi:MAG TPA: TM2 domain-containing protein [Candidatus Onthoplasma faecigallinarum]|nr:TM2 domain-containing protein [Candidatus Onthoplasma faecigallinarum]
MDERERVLYRRGCPSDVSKVKLLLLTIFLGFTGAHHYYVGRTGKGIFYSIFFVIGVVNAILTTVLQSTPHGELWEIFTLLVLIWGVVIMMWLIDIADVILNRYKIPVSLPKK